jgi:hypothetical protein
MPKVERKKSNAAMVRAVRDGLPGSYEWDDRDRILLALALAQARDLDLLEADVAKHGVRSPAGRLSTIVSEARQARVALARILGQVDVPDAPDLRSLHASRAAQARWRAG